MKVVVLVPAYNEEARLREVIDGLRAVADASEEHSVSIYVINDGSADRTPEIAREAGADRVLTHQVNLGLGAAVRTGLLAAGDDGFDVAVKFDADLQHSPDDVLKMVVPIAGDEADVVYGHRFNKISYRMPFVRRTGNKAFTGLMRYLTGWDLKDSQPGIIAMSRRYFQDFYMPGDYNYTQQILMDAYLRGMRFAHVDVHFNERTTGSSFISWKYPFKVLLQIAQVIVGINPIRLFGPIAVALILLATLVGGFDLLDWVFGDAAKPIEHVNFTLGVGLFGVQTLFFGLLADLIVKMGCRRK
ncbi:Glycosyltransferase involved in cell wall bisynthesis [Paucidesulfovibrio gracilis DSM 16080]|uniref:Glycosyltransferase involved in cell wall bisynthesis n=1 Tax=Paucidesulfovibrio gracilis DSM 16080 TaxID=1121449 RepID=A0A1T4WZ62_9BACT|nr:glycosyltransferase family 2 protein [Paucidesulfovibrio gracilis]SKA82539.1 Glycosyltransferase involved in cell wall bisynthesis [Paucidesulfovibrio gracilis DSM 16080]